LASLKIVDLPLQSYNHKLGHKIGSIGSSFADISWAKKDISQLMNILCLT